MTTKVLGWQITVTLPDGNNPHVYNVAIAEERQALDAVRALLDDPTGAVLKVKSELTARVYKGLGLRPGDVLAGAQRKKVVRA